jgi:ADP-heptose:LPS heptosyltransferase
VRKLLVLKLWGMGSIVLASPLLQELRARYPEARVVFVTLEENAAILR